ncbi:MAG: hypothetical protein Aurels2KO_23060 [Aureliella sp.]
MLIKKRFLRNLLQVLILSLVAWGIYATIKKSAAELQTQQTALQSEADQLSEQAKTASSPQERDKLLADARRMREQAEGYWRADPWGLLLAATLYAAGMFPAAVFWRRCLATLGQRTLLLETLWAYFLGNLGKYFPGKAMVLVLRIDALKHRQVKKTATAITIFMETLSLMSVGGAVAALSLIWLNIDWRLTAMAAGLLAVTFIPTMPPVLRRLIPILQRGVDQAEIQQWTSRISWRLLLSGWTALAITWTLFGLSLYTVLLSLPSTEAAETGRVLVSAMAACSLAVVLGFVSLIPGGAGVREVVLSAVLAPVVGVTTALCAAVWMRIIWLCTELAVVIVLAGLRKLTPTVTDINSIERDS